MHQTDRRAVVLGAGIAGLLAARVVSDAYGRVTVVERDPLPRAAESRRGVPQGRHAHLLLPGGTQILDGLFPGLLDHLAATGVPVVRDFAEFWLAPGGGRPLSVRGPAADPFLCQAGRPTLEQHVRDRVCALPNVTVADRCDATGLTADPERRRVTGVRVRRATGGEETTIDADLVVDATGRGSRAPAWLEALGYDQPRQERLAVNLTYLTRHLRIPPGTLTAKVAGVGAEPGRPSGFILLAQENDRWILTVFGYDGHHPVRDTAGMLATVRAAAPEHLYAAVRDAEPLDDIVAYRFPANIRRRYDRLRRFPDGFLVLGDAIGSTNPVYALGMSTAAMEAVALRDALTTGDRGLPLRFFRAAATPLGRAWQATVGGDLGLPAVHAPRPPAVRVAGRYAARALRAASRDQVVAGQFLRVGSLQDPAARMFRPAIAIRVLRHGRAGQ
ncbi:FAD-dependent oxidoreductase [Paractinoplanes globisporus]|uniref:FAD-dependent oxidoreductase n=1 Tax=Paractinoplanes globisporus TaxID=113565 RepID=A0ABW6WCH1_9ACTN|nr:FAD-dependent monooxygenase [Actinoplanes globisporus]